jgi:hypothetical protein
MKCLFTLALDYLDFAIPWINVKTIIQLRANMSYIMSTKLQDLLYFYKNQDHYKCRCCKSDLKENIFHFMCQCNRYKLLRLKFIPEFSPPRSETDFWKLLCNISPKHIHVICTFIKLALKLRDIVLGN